ncbi:hypothetical protein Tco_0619581 [Tanacetum coccineum]
MIARISIRDEPSISLPPREELFTFRNEECVCFIHPSHEVGESSAAGAARQDRPTIAREDLYGFIDMVDRGVNQRVTDLATIVEEETTSMYGIMEDAQDGTGITDREAKMAREAWGLSMDASDYARLDVMSLRTTVVAQSALISELQSADHRRQFKPLTMKLGKIGWCRGACKPLGDVHRVAGMLA